MHTFPNIFNTNGFIDIRIVCSGKQQQHHLYLNCGCILLIKVVPEKKAQQQIKEHIIKHIKLQKIKKNGKKNINWLHMHLLVVRSYDV